MPENERFIRWQGIAIEQLGYTLNLTLTLTIAALGYCIALLRQVRRPIEPCAAVPMVLSMLVLFSSSALGVICVVNRLHDFRGTAKLTGGNGSAPTRDELHRLGERTWCLFYAHVATFALGLVFLLATLLLMYGGKLSPLRSLF